MDLDQQITISELRDKKWTLIENMEKLVEDFMAETGVSVDDVDCDISKTFGGNPADFKVSVKIKLDVGF